MSVYYYYYYVITYQMLFVGRLPQCRSNAVAIVLCIGGLSHCEMPEGMTENTDVSLVSGKLRRTGTRPTEDDTGKHGRAIVNTRYMLLSPNSIIWYRSRGSDALWLGR